MSSRLSFHCAEGFATQRLAEIPPPLLPGSGRCDNSHRGRWRPNGYIRPVLKHGPGSSWLHNGTTHSKEKAVTTCNSPHNTLNTISLGPHYGFHIPPPPLWPPSEVQLTPVLRTGLTPEPLQKKNCKSTHSNTCALNQGYYSLHTPPTLG